MGSITDYDTNLFKNTNYSASTKSKISKLSIKAKQVPIRNKDNEENWKNSNLLTGRIPNLISLLHIVALFLREINAANHCSSYCNKCHLNTNHW